MFSKLLAGFMVAAVSSAVHAIPAKGMESSRQAITEPVGDEAVGPSLQLPQAAPDTIQPSGLQSAFPPPAVLQKWASSHPIAPEASPSSEKKTLSPTGAPTSITVSPVANTGEDSPVDPALTDNSDAVVPSDPVSIVPTATAMPEEEAAGEGQTAPTEASPGMLAEDEEPSPSPQEV